MLRATSAAAAAAVLTPVGQRKAGAATPVQVLSSRYPALEYYADRIRKAVPDLPVEMQMMPFDKSLELITIALSSKSQSVDLVYATESTFRTFAKNGWIRPLDDLWAKYKEEFKLDDFADQVLDLFRYDGKLYVMPFTTLEMFFFYRKDLFDQAGKQPPKTIAEYHTLAKQMNSPMRAGTIKCLKTGDSVLNESHWYINALGEGWFDRDYRPIFHNDKGIQAIEALKEVTAYAQSGFTAAANDECMIALQQDLAAMGPQWSSRALAMDDPNKSRVVGKFEWVPLPQGGGKISMDGYCISSFSKQTPDDLFRILATATNEQNMRGAASMMVPPRKTLLNDADLKAKYRYYPAAIVALETGKPVPLIPEWYAVGESISRRIVQGITGQMSVKEALATAAKEAELFLRDKGYYKG
jgi:ABC-type glycerol-3-phosphate transport system substrate-binding protein